MADPTPTSPAEFPAGLTVGDLLSENRRLIKVESEYNTLTRVASVLIERLLALTGGRAVEISDEAIERARGTKGWRDESRRVVMITVL